MKKYVKPELFYERYELSQHIADCGWELQWADGACKATGDKNIWGDMSETLFSVKLACDYQIDSEDPNNKYQQYCYQNGADAIKVAMS